MTYLRDVLAPLVRARYARHVQRIVFAVLWLWMGAIAGAGCIPDEIRVCDVRPEENTCSGDGDCVLAFCATDCWPCPNAYSVRQVEATWCLTLQGNTPLVDCEKGKDERCRGTIRTPCAYGIEPYCNAGRCDIKSRVKSRQSRVESRELRVER